MRTLAIQGDDTGFPLVSFLFGDAFCFFSQNRSLRFEEVDSHLFLQCHGKKLSKAVSADEVIALFPAHIGDGVDRLGDSVELAYVKRIYEVVVKGAQFLLCYLVRIHLNSRVVEHERHELAISFAIEVAKLLELDDLGKPAFQKRLIVDDGRSLLESAFEIGFAVGLLGACRDEPGKFRQAI